MGVNPAIGEDRVVLGEEIKDGRRKAFHDAPTFIPAFNLHLPLAQQHLGSSPTPQRCRGGSAPERRGVGDRRGQKVVSGPRARLGSSTQEESVSCPGWEGLVLRSAAGGRTAVRSGSLPGGSASQAV